MADFPDELAFFRSRLFRMMKGDNAGLLRSDAIHRVMEQHSFSFSAEDEEQIRRVLESEFVIQEAGAAVLSEYRPWLEERRNDIKFDYWDRLKNYYIREGNLPATVVAVLDTVTDELLDYCGNPADEESWSRRGMVMGHVQSGKTTNYGALICKASDAGYKVIVLLTGLTNDLRAQTQGRLDETFIGRQSVFNARNENRVGVGRGSPFTAAYGTTVSQDFSRNSVSSFGVTVGQLKDPIIFVTKKNKSILENLRAWLSENIVGEHINEPLLLIDDEADNASINTSNTNETTAINAAIRRILAMFSRSTYIGYTATPFANIFIDPDTEDEMLKDDLFPKHFIKALDPPENYVGARRIFTDRGDLRASAVVVIDDFQDILPLIHKIDHDVFSLPESLRHAVRVFCLTLALRNLRGQGNEHCTMMINVSRFNNIQAKILGLVYTYVEEIRNSLVVHGDRVFSSSTDPRIHELEQSFIGEFVGRTFEGKEYKFSDLQHALLEAVPGIQVKTVNMRRKDKLDYKSHEKGGLHVIAIGGFALSRGLTLEGLTTSYILRNTAASDTLMQMARWFGYRDKYEDLCRIFLPQTALDHYEYVEEATEELRDDVKAMESIKATPSEFGLKVRQSPATLRITAANKMRSSTLHNLAVDYSGTHVEGYAVYNDGQINTDNMKAASEFLQPLGSPKISVGSHSWLNVKGTSVIELIDNFRFPPIHKDLGHVFGNHSLLRDYVVKRMEDELEFWDVAIPHRRAKAEQDKVKIFGLKFVPRSRVSGVASNGAWKFTKKNKVAAPSGEDAVLLMTEDERKVAESYPNGKGYQSDSNCCRARKKPLLLIHVVDKINGEQERKFEAPVVTLSFCLPATTVRAVEEAYQINEVYRQQLELTLESDDDDLKDIFEK